MKRKLIAIAAIAAIVSAAWAAQRVWVKLADNITLGVSTEVIDSVKYDAAGQNILLVTKNDTTGTLARSSITKLTVGDGTDDVEINFVGDDAEIINPYAFEGVEVTKDGADVVVKSTTDLELRYRITGTTTTGQVKIYSDKRFTLALDGANITNNDGSAINIQSKKKITVELVDGTTTNLVDASKYTKTPADEDEKACFFSEGQLVFTGNGTLNVTGNKKHAIASDDYVRIDSGTINIVSSKSDGLHANDYFLMKGGIFRSAASAGDGIDADAGYIVIDDGLIDVTVATADTKAVKADSIITINGGTLNLTVSGDQAKGIKSKHNIFINGGKITSNVTGKVVVTEGDPSYATAIKTDRNITITEGEIDITATGEAAKGISVDSVATVSGGTIKIVASGANGSYTDAEGQPDTYSSTAFSVDCETNISGGTLDITAGGNDGKGINSDKDVTISGGTIKLTVSGNQAKGIKTKKKFTMTAGTITGTMTGNVVVEDGDASYCTGIKVKKAFAAQGGSINFNASGTAAKGISADSDATFSGTNVTITASGGYGTYTNAEGQADDYSSAAIKVDENATFSAGTVDVTADNFAAKGISTDGDVTISGGTVKVTAKGTKSKGIKTDGKFTMTSGTLTGVTSGSAIVENYDPSYCTAVKSAGDITFNGGTINITGSGRANKGISGDANGYFNGGNFTIKETGNGGTYRLADNTIDGLSSTCITIDGNLDMIGGTYNLNNSGTAGKCLKVDGVAVFGNTTQGPSITANTSGAKISKSSVTWTNPQSIEDEPVIVPQEGPGGPGGPGDNQKYANPKVIKAVGNLTVNNGTLVLSSTQDGGEGLESKQTLTINGGSVKCTTVDDGINAKTSLVINGGQVYCNASNNDAIDSNGTMTITGGIVIALGALAPEEGLDCDNNAFSITGGTVIGIGSGNSTVTNKGSNQTFVTLNQTLAQGASLSYTTSGGGHFKFTNPRAYTGGGGGPGGGGGGSSRLGILISYPKNATSTGTYTTYFSCLQLDY